MKGNILIVDDTAANLDILSLMLTQHGHKVRPVMNGQTALSAARLQPPDIILLDINMPIMNGYEVCQHLKSDPQTANIPVIFISALDDTVDKVRAFQVGGVDYITKPFQMEEVLVRIENQLTMYWQRRELEMLREKDRLYFEELNKIKDQFVHTVSHDIKNPLSIIKLFAGLLKKREGIQNDTKAQDYIERIVHGVDQMHRLVTDLLDLAKIETGLALQLAPTDLKTLLLCSVENFEIMAQEKNIHLSLSVPDVKVCADTSRMEQVLNNLISNAIKYTPPEGAVHITAEAEDKTVTVRVIDSGLGIPKEDLQNLFEKFYRVNKDDHLAPEGTGLGLAIVKAIVEKHRGKIWAENNPEGGSIFSFTLPRNS